MDVRGEGMINNTEQQSTIIRNTSMSNEFACWTSAWRLAETTSEKTSIRGIFGWRSSYPFQGQNRCKLKDQPTRCVYECSIPHLDDFILGEPLLWSRLCDLCSKLKQIFRSSQGNKNLCSFPFHSLFFFTRRRKTEAKNYYTSRCNWICTFHAKVFLASISKEAGGVFVVPSARFSANAVKRLKFEIQ